MAEKIKFQWRLNVILGLLMAFGPLPLDMYLPTLPRVAEDLHASRTNAQLSLTVSLVSCFRTSISRAISSDLYQGRSLTKIF